VVSGAGYRHWRQDVRNITSVDIWELDGDVVGGDKSEENEGYNDKVRRITEVLTHKQSVIFTDGFVYGGVVGCGACAAVYCAKGSEDEFLVKVKEVGYNVSSDRCEIEGIILSLEIVIPLIAEGHAQGQNECTYILCDCQKAIDAFTVHSEFRKYSKIWERTLIICDKLFSSSYQVKLVKIPGHSAILGNDIADQKAKETASEIKIGFRMAPSEMSVLDARKVCTEIANKSWQRKWDEDKKGRSTYEFLPIVGTKVLWPRKRESEFYVREYCYMTRC